MTVMSSHMIVQKKLPTENDAEQSFLWSREWEISPWRQ